MTGLAAAQIDAAGAEIVDADTLRVSVPPDQVREMRVLVTAPRGTIASRDITFVLADPARNERAVARDHFVGPKD